MMSKSPQNVTYAMSQQKEDMDSLGLTSKDKGGAKSTESTPQRKTQTRYKIYVEPITRQRLFDMNLPAEVDIVWAWDVRGVEDKSRETGRDNWTTSSLAHGYSASKTEAHQEAEKWADALSQKTEYVYTPKVK